LVAPDPEGLDTFISGRHARPAAHAQIRRPLLLLADHEPQSPLEWEQWIKAARKALRVNVLIAPAAAGRADNPDGFTTQHLLHAHCSRQFAGTLARGLRKA
jgi:hypothetical protein